MKGTILYGPRDIRFEERDEPQIIESTDAILRLAATCVCGSDLWPYRGIDAPTQPTPMGHEYCGIVEEVGPAVRSVKPGQFVVGSFFASDNTCPICQAGYPSRCLHSQYVGAGGAQAPRLRVPLADGTLVAAPDLPSDELIPSLLAASDVLGTGWFGAVAANVKPGTTVAVAGDGAVGLLAVLAARQLGAERIIAMSRHELRQKLGAGVRATDIVTERGDEGAATVKELTGGLGAHSGWPRRARCNSADGRFLIAVDAGSNQISVLRVHSDGSLSLVHGGVVSSRGVLLDSIAVHGDLVYVANSGPGHSNYTGFR